MNDTLTSPTHAELVAKLTNPGNFGWLVDRTLTHSTDLHKAGDTTTRLELACSHDKEGKRFTARLSVVGVIDRGNGVTVTVARPFERNLSRRMPPAPVARYSAKALMAYRTLCMEELRLDPSWLDGLDLGPWATPASPAGGGISAIAKL